MSMPSWSPNVWTLFPIPISFRGQFISTETIDLLLPACLLWLRIPLVHSGTGTFTINTSTTTTTTINTNSNINNITHVILNVDSILHKHSLSETVSGKPLYPITRWYFKILYKRTKAKIGFRDLSKHGRQMKKNLRWQFSSSLLYFKESFPLSPARNFTSSVDQRCSTEFATKDTAKAEPKSFLVLSKP